MKKLTIRNLGPLKEVSIELGRVNLIIGLESSGKSCILKTACHCSWVEKRIEIMQEVGEFSEGSWFLDSLEKYYNMHDFVDSDTYIEYESSFMRFAFDNNTKLFNFKWKAHRWDFRRPKISYVPSDRNLVAAISDWRNLPLGQNLIDFMRDWDIARKEMKHVENILNIGMSYSYDSSIDVDRVILSSGRRIYLSDSSSGVQSLFPLFIHLGYLFKGHFWRQSGNNQSFKHQEEHRRLVNILASHMSDDEMVNSLTEGRVVKMEGNSYYFSENHSAERFEALASRYLYTDHNEIFLEEPENNLFPPTQCQLVNWLLECITKNKKKDILFVATHSPYVLNQFIKDAPADLQVFITHPNVEGYFYVKQLTKEEIRDVYDNGVDLFLNFEAYI